MRLSCASSRIVAAAVLGYIGAAPVPNATIRDAVVIIAVAGAIAWPRLRGRSSLTCAVPAARPVSRTSHETPSQVAAIESTEVDHVQ